MDNYEVLEVVHTSSSNESVILKVKEKSRPTCEKVYALKLVGSLDNRLQKLIFKREVEALRKLNACENVVRIRHNKLNVEFNGKPNWGAILLDYVYGENLETINLDNFSIDKRYAICMKILKAVEDAHSYSVLHRDIKPSNIMYNEETEEVTLIDFGTSKIKSIIENETTLPFYSPNYSAPEIVRGQSSTEASDIYSLGAVMFKILYGVTPQGTNMIIATMGDMESQTELRSLISKMVAENAEDRFQNVGDIIGEFERIIGSGVVNAENYICAIDVEKLEFLKKKSMVEKNTTMAILVNSFLKSQFRNCTAYQDNNTSNYIFSGKKVSIECIYDSTEDVFKVVRINQLSLDRRLSNEKRGFAIKGQLRFFDSSKKNTKERLGYNNNENLLIDFRNNAANTQDIQRQAQLFDDLFGKWLEGIDETMENEKSRSGRIKYSAYELSDYQLVLTIDEYQNGNIDDLTNETQYIIEDVNNRGQSIYYDLGSFGSVNYDDESVLLVIDLCKNIQRGKVKALLSRGKRVMENFRAKMSAYQKQSRAIRALHDDNYSAKNLKDILLTLETPSSIPALDDISFSSPDFNDSQKKAIRKVMYSDSISLIQGPPGTGKTKVIKEIVRQIISCVDKVDEMPKILIVSQSHTAVDNIIEDLINFNGNRLDIIRIGKKDDIAKKVYENCAIESIREGMFVRIQNQSNAYIQEKEALYSGVTDVNEIQRWEKIKEIQKDWINRCSSLESLDYQVIKCATIIAGTCIGFLSNDYVKDLDFDYVIIDEAAKATTPELLVSIIKAKKIVLVGDQNQLPAYADRELSPIIADLTRNEKYRLFDILFEELPDTHRQVLTEQYRMRKNIGNLISQVFYKNTVHSPVPDSQREHGIKMFEGKSIIWIDTKNMHNRGESSKKGGSYCNYAENAIIKKLLIRFREEGILESLDMGIITGYKGQKELIRKTVTNSGFDKIAKTIDINTLDAFQGRENDIIIYSTVRTKRSIGFQKEKERVNVAFSRARNLLIVCGDLDFFYHFDDPDNKFIEIIDYITEHSEECQIIPGEKI